MIVTHAACSDPVPPPAASGVEPAAPGPQAPAPGGSVVSIGVFDGVHLGHQAILRANVRRARELGATPAVITFRRHPKRVLLGRAPRTLTSLEHRLELFRQAGIGHTLVLAFDGALRALSPEDFVERFARSALLARAFVLGFDSKFGRDRRGTPESLAAAGHAVEVVDKVVVDGRAVSSTAIREAVELGDLEGAGRMLGRPVSVLGTVVAGDARGRELGFPTANLNLHHELHPPVGVYAGRARVFRRGRPEGAPGTGDRGPEGRGSKAGAGDRGEVGGVRTPFRAVWEPVEGAIEWDAVANLGRRPTVEPGATEPRLEVHLLDFPGPGAGSFGDGELYGAHLEFRFLAHLRGERRFDSLGALREQIGGDVEAARRALARRGAPEGGPRR